MCGRLVLRSLQKWKTDSCTMVVLIHLKDLLQNFQVQRQSAYKIPLPWTENFFKLYTTDAGQGFKVSVAIFPSSGGVEFLSTRFDMITKIIRESFCL